MTYHPDDLERLDSTVNSDRMAKPTTDTESGWPEHRDQAQDSDHFVQRDGIEFAGTHIIIDLWGARHLDDIALIEQTLRDAVIAANATLLHIHLHHFTPGGGVSGVAVLAESHISVHTWPERGFAAFDVFMCGDAKPEATLPILRAVFEPSRMSVSEHLRGADSKKSDTSSSEVRGVSSDT